MRVIMIIRLSDYQSLEWHKNRYYGSRYFCNISKRAFYWTTWFYL